MRAPGVGAGQDGRVTERDRADTVVLLVLWVLPLLAASGLLAAAGLPLLAGALLVVEAGVGLCVHLARRRPARNRGPAPGWVVPAAMVGVLVAMVGVTLVAVALG
jgi:hypothetical protein